MRLRTWHKYCPASSPRAFVGDPAAPLDSRLRGNDKVKLHQMLRYLRVGFACLLAGVCMPSWALDLSDPLLTTPDIAVTGAMLAGEKITPCIEGKVGRLLTLYEAVERALCSNPQTIGAWLNIKAQAAQEGLAKGALLPVISGSVQASRSHAYSSVGEYEQFASDSRTSVRSEALNLS